MPCPSNLKYNGHTTILTNMKNLPSMGLMVDSSKVTFLPSSKSCDTKTRINVRNLALQNLDIVS